MNPTYPSGEIPEQETLNVVDQGIAAADAEGMTEEERRKIQAEEDTVAEAWKSYDTARKFDEQARAQYAIDRRYAAGTENLDWAVSANLIGAFIDILVSFLYARDPDVSVKKPEKVINSNTADEDDFAKTLQIVISRLWKAPNTRFKAMIRRQVRSALSVGVGWVKVVLVCKGTNIPQMQADLSDIRKNVMDLEAAIKRTEDPEYAAETTPEKLHAEMENKRQLEISLTNRLEVAMRKMLVVDFVPAEQMQVSLNVREVADYVNADWVANEIFKPQCDVLSMFPRLTKENIGEATLFYQRKRRQLTPLADRQKLTGLADIGVNPEEAEQFVSGKGDGDSSSGIPFVRIVERWNKTTGFVETMIDGVKRWAREPYQPDYPTTRFYPYFGLAFYEVDGERHPQSLTWRLMKLADEYCATRSSLRLTRERAIPGILYDSGEVDGDQAAKVAKAAHQEYIPLKPTTPNKPLRDLFTEKPIARIDVRLFDVQPIMSDMERISGVQEALQSGVSQPKTATEAEIEQAGFASRTTSDRDCLEIMLTELAQATAEAALTGIDTAEAQRMAGTGAFWPQGMAIDDLLTMAEVTIEAGTTGKPKQAGDREAWGIVMPVIKEMQGQISMLEMQNPPLAEAMKELIRETMKRLGDDTDPERFIPKPLQPMALPGALPPGGPIPAAGAPGALPPGPVDGGAPPVPGDPAALVPPELLAENLAPPEMQPPVV